MGVGRRIPRELEEAIERAIDVEAASGQRPIADAFEERQHILKVTHAVLDRWHAGEVTMDEAVRALEYLVRSLG
jgi:hypothetical protein